jgi:hypothetical protein
LNLPGWFWGGSVDGYFRAAWLATPVDALPESPAWVETLENRDRTRPRLVAARSLAGPGASAAGEFDALDQLDTTALRDLNDAASPPELPEQLQAAQLRAERGGLTGALWLYQLHTILARHGATAATVRAIHAEILNLRFEDDGDIIFPHAGVVVVQRAAALLHRTHLPAVLLRLVHDEELREADVTRAAAANAAGDLVFAGSHRLNAGVLLLDTYLAPLFGALTPFVWAIPATRPSGTVVYTLGRGVAGTAGEAAEPLQLLPGRGPKESMPTPEIAPAGANAAVLWWARRLDKLLSVASDPAVFCDSARQYVPSKHLHGLLSIDQLFRRVASIQRAHRDADARAVLLFTVLDTLERVTSRSLTTMCTLSFAKRALERLRKAMPADAATILLPAAERAVQALEAVQDGFYLQRQRGDTHVRFPDAAGVEEVLPPEMAAAEYIRVLRNATHGHGSNREASKARTNALLAQHDGDLPHDLALLGYLYLLEFLTNPAAARRAFYNNGRV